MHDINEHMIITGYITEVSCSCDGRRLCTASVHGVCARRLCTASVHGVCARRPCTASHREPEPTLGESQGNLSVSEGAGSRKANVDTQSPAAVDRRLIKHSTNVSAPFVQGGAAVIPLYGRERMNQELTTQSQSQSRQGGA
ncbi:uncharacterized protein V6R79_018559 [Siganus canaliculatus]